MVAAIEAISKLVFLLFYLFILSTILRFKECGIVYIASVLYKSRKNCTSSDLQKKKKGNVIDVLKNKVEKLENGYKKNIGSRHVVFYLYQIALANAN